MILLSTRYKSWLEKDFQMKQKPIRGNKTNKRRISFANGSLERKVQRQEIEQSKFDAETERMIKKFSGNKKEPS